VTRRVGDIVIIEPEDDGVCDLCGAVEETRPYGPNGEDVCFDCMKKNEPAAKKRFRALLGETEPQ
jgi:hypothetical protein